MVTLSSDSRPIIGRGPPLGARFFFLAVFSIVIMVLDHRGGYLETTRYWLGIATNPVYSAVQAPFSLWGWLTDSFSDRTQLREDNELLTKELRVARVQLLRFDSLVEENRRLRAIRSASQGIAERTLIAEIIHVDVDPFRHRVRINKGSVDGVFKGQAVLDAFGIVGQVTGVDRWTSEIILISDNEHAIPVQVNRNGIRSIAVGIGDIHRLSLPFLTIESDVKPDDLLVTSGLDGVFPAGYPVARILKVERNPAETFAVVEARPMAQLDRAREVLLLWFDKSTPVTGAPPEPEAAASKTEGAPAKPARTTSSGSTPSVPATRSEPRTAPTPAPRPSTNPATPATTPSATRSNTSQAGATSSAPPASATQSPAAATSPAQNPPSRPSNSPAPTTTTPQSSTSPSASPAVTAPASTPPASSNAPATGAATPESATAPLPAATQPAPAASATPAANAGNAPGGGSPRPAAPAPATETPAQ